MKKLVPIVYFILGLAFIAQGAGLIPLVAALPKWFPLAVGWCFIILGLFMLYKINKSQKRSEETAEVTEVTETEATEDQQ